MIVHVLCNTEFIEEKSSEFSLLAASLCDWDKLRTPLQMPYAVSRSREWVCVPLPAWETSFVILGGGGEESHLPHVQRDRELVRKVTKAGVPVD